MNASQRAAQLRAQAEQYETVGVLENALEGALGAYRAAPGEQAKAAYREASQRLAEARSAARAEAETAVAAQTIEASGSVN